MRVAVIGSGRLRSGIEKYIPEGTTQIITGGAFAAGRLAEKWADKNGIPKLVIKPDYARYGESAPLARNRLIIEIADFVIVIWNGKSLLTKYSIEYAKNTGKPFKVQLISDRN